MPGPLNVVILAAGFGSRMKSEKHKMLHEVAGVPMVQLVIEAARELNPDRIVLVVGHAAEQVRSAMADQDVEFVHQAEQLGTAHAFLQAAQLLEDAGGRLLVLNGDGALITADTLRRLEAALPGEGMALLTARVPDPSGLGRVVKGADGLVERTVEHKDATEAELRINEIVVGTYLFDRRGFEFARGLDNDNAAGEYYITDLIAAYRAAGLPVGTSDTPLDEYGGINNRSQLAAAERIFQSRLREHWLLNGVTMQAPETVFIERSVVLEPDVVLEPFVILRGNTRVGRAARIGSHSVVSDREIAAGQSVAPHSKL